MPAARKSNAAKTRPSRQERDARIIAGILEQMDNENLAPWQMPWAKNLTRQANALSGKPYRGINCLTTAARNFFDHRWVTYKQAQAAGGNIRKGEHGTRVVFWKFPDREEKTRTTGTTARATAATASLCGSTRCSM